MVFQFPTFLVYLFMLAPAVYGLDIAKFSAVFRKRALGVERSQLCYLEM